jgi:hypothetical protein
MNMYSTFHVHVHFNVNVLFMLMLLIMLIFMLIFFIFMLLFILMFTYVFVVIIIFKNVLNVTIKLLNCYYEKYITVKLLSPYCYQKTISCRLLISVTKKDPENQRNNRSYTNNQY